MLIFGLSLVVALVLVALGLVVIARDGFKGKQANMLSGSYLIVAGVVTLMAGLTVFLIT